MVKFLYYAVGETTPRVMDMDLNSCKVFQDVCKSLVHNHTLSTMHDKNNPTRRIYDVNNTFYYAVYNDTFLVDDTRPLNILATILLCGNISLFKELPFIRDGVCIMKFKPKSIENPDEEHFIDCTSIADIV